MARQLLKLTGCPGGFYTRTVRIPGLFVIVRSILASVPLAACTSSSNMLLPSLSPPLESFTPGSTSSPVSVATFSRTAL
jgi:hypothetical protein